MQSMVSRILRPNAGTVSVNGDDIWTPTNDQLADFRLNRIGFVFRDYHLFTYNRAIEYIPGTRFTISYILVQAKSDAAIAGIKPLTLATGSASNWSHW
jgi:ABC-type lipoprotein export system ATPase subunit